MKIAVIGYGVVGKHQSADIERAGHELWVHDIHTIPRHNATWGEVNECDAAFVCVSTPSAPDGSCDTSAIQDVFSWLDVPVALIRSTIPPGTTQALASQCVRGFIPEFIGEGVNAPYNAMRQPPFLILGTDSDLARERAVNVLSRLYNSECEFVCMSTVSAELAKYAENYYLALKVTWANELHDLAELTGADYNKMMNGVTHDYRIGRSHTHVYPDNRGWDGRCLPKDTAALLALVGAENAPLLAAVRAVNARHRAKNALEAGQPSVASPATGGNGHV